MTQISYDDSGNVFLTHGSGARLCFREYGDPQGKPLFFFHGWPSSRLQAKGLDTVAKKLHLRIISPDRPGFGLSDFDSKRTLLDWANTIAQLADALGINKFSVLGNSGGGPYAAVCAYALPDRVQRTGISVGLAPTNVNGVLKGMAFVNKLTWKAYHYLPFLMTLSPWLQYIKLRLFPRDMSEAYPSDIDKKMLTQKFKDSYIKNRAEAYRQGIRGASHDLKLYSSDWGFDLSQIRVPVFLWYGAHDKNASVEMGKYYHRMIHTSTLQIYEDDGHTLLVRQTEEILGWFRIERKGNNRD